MELPNEGKKGELTVLEKSRELYALVAKVEADDNLIPRYYKDSLGIPIVTHARDIFENCSVANSINLFDQEAYPERRRHQLQALYSVAKLLATLRIVYTLAQLSADKMQVLLTKAIEVKRLCAKWMESDKNRIGASLQIVAKDPIETNLFDKGITAKDLFSDGPRVDFDAIYKAASNAPVPERHHETGQTFYIPPPPAPKTTYQNVAPADTRTREQRIADMLAGRRSLDERPTVADPPQRQTEGGVQAKPLGTSDPDNSIGPVVEPTATDVQVDGPLSDNLKDIAPKNLAKIPKTKK